jgi:hypothetical protein
MPEFVPGMELSRSFFAEVVQPILEDRFPSLQYAAALLGSGSEVLGYDTEMSTDHGWGPRVDLFLRENEPTDLHTRIDTTLRECLPPTFRGYSTNFGAPDRTDGGTQLPAFTERGPINHKIEILTAGQFFAAYLGVDVYHALEPADWLTLPEQKLRTIASGAVFHDAIGLQGLRETLAYYPHDVWLYLLASQWVRIGQEEHLMGRAGMAGDEIGAAIIAARLVRDLMQLCFLMERAYAPYPKWFGTAFRELACADELLPHLHAVLSSEAWQGRERWLVCIYEVVAAKHNTLGITDPLPTKVRRFFTRPFEVIALHGYADAIADRITDESVRRLTRRRLIGSIDQFSDSTDLLSYPEFRPALKQLYQ